MAKATVINFQVLTVMNTEPNQNQTITTTQEPKIIEQPVEILKPIRNLEIRNVSRQVYNTLRSFVESSDKSTYPWNVGIRINNDTVVFEKRNRWKLYIYPHNGYFKLRNWRGDLIIDIERKMDDKLTNLINIYDRENKLSFDVYDENTLHFVAITTNAPFARPIRLLEIVEKLCKYGKFLFCG